MSFDPGFMSNCSFHRQGVEVSRAVSASAEVRGQAPHRRSAKAITPAVPQNGKGAQKPQQRKKSVAAMDNTFCGEKLGTG